MFTIALVLMICVAITCLVLAARLIWIGRQEKAAAQKRLIEDLADPDVNSTTSRLRFVGVLHRLGEALARGGYSRNLRQNLSRAGFHSSSAPAVYMGAKFLSFAVGLVAGCAIVLNMKLELHTLVALVVMVSGLAFMVPNLVVARRRGRIRAETHRFLPDAIDLLEICVSSGMALGMAWNSVAQEIRRVSPVLADEMELTNLEMGLGIERSVAMRNMAERTGAKEIDSLVALMVQADRFGASILEALQTFASSMREVSSRKAEERAEKMAVKMLAPMVLFIFPSLLLVMVGPAVMQIIDVMT